MQAFKDLGINDNIIKALSDLGFLQPTPVQEEVIPLMLRKRVDLVSLAQTGTGKTAAFGVPLVQLADAGKKQTQGLVLCPTRELCMQVARDLESFGKYIKGLRVLSVYGGASIEQQIRSLRQGVQIVVATPGRLKDLLQRRVADLSSISFVVFDEADEMLQMGFQDDLAAILENTPKEKSTMLFSATMSQEVAAISRKYMHKPVELTIGTKNAGAEKVRHEFYMVHVRDRYAALKRIVDNSPDIYSIIFCRTRRETGEVADKLIQDGYSADSLHGDLSQSQRDHVMHKFRCRNLQILVATDVAARGLDVNDLSHVINYNLPDDIAAYTHRSGRTGRAGQTGISVVIVTAQERYRLKSIERKIQKKFTQCSVPTGPEICRKQMINFMDEVTGVTVDSRQIDPLYEQISRKLEHLDRGDLIKHFVSLQFNKFLEYYKNAPDLNVMSEKENKRTKFEQNRREQRKTTPPSGKFTTFTLNVGRRQGIAPLEIIGKINEIKNVGRIKVGRIEILRNSARVEVDSRYASQIIDEFQHADINGKTVSIEVSKVTIGDDQKLVKRKSTKPWKNRRAPVESRRK